MGMLSLNYERYGASHEQEIEFKSAEYDDGEQFEGIQWYESKSIHEWHFYIWILLATIGSNATIMKTGGMMFQSLSAKDQGQKINAISAKRRMLRNQEIILSD